MAGSLAAVGSRVLGGHGAAASALRHRAGMGLPVGNHIVQNRPLPVNDELVWDNGIPFPEPCVDRLAPHIVKYEALAWLCGGLGFFAALGLAAAVNDKASKMPYMFPSVQLPVNDKLVWDNGTPFPEPCVDRLAPHIGKYEELAWLCGGLSFFAALGLAAAVNDKASKMLSTPKVYPYDNLMVELGHRL